MNYKTMMICALLAGSMHQAWGMDSWLIEAERFFLADNKIAETRDVCTQVCPEWEKNPQFEDVREKVDAHDREREEKNPFIMLPEDLGEYATQVEEIAKDLEDTLAEYNKIQVDSAVENNQNEKK